WATVSTQVPIRLSDCPDTYGRKFGTARAANMAGSAGSASRWGVVMSAWRLPWEMADWVTQAETTVRSVQDLSLCAGRWCAVFVPGSAQPHARLGEPASQTLVILGSRRGAQITRTCDGRSPGRSRGLRPETMRTRLPAKEICHV